MLFQSAKTDFRKDGWQWLKSNDDACSKQFNRQRHEGYVGNALPSLTIRNLIQVNQAAISEQVVGMNRHNVTVQSEADEAWRYPEGVKIGISRSCRLNLTSGGKAQPRP